MSEKKELTPSEKLRLLADGRSQYLDVNGPYTRDLKIQVDTLRLAAKVLEGDKTSVWAFLPSWLWEDWRKKTGQDVTTL